MTATIRENIAPNAARRIWPRRAVLSAAAWAGAGAATGAVSGCAGGDRELVNGRVRLEFQSLAYQPATVAAVKRIVADWNRARPDIQIVYRQGSWDSVHDQLVTQFTGGTEPTIIHNDAADMEGFAQMGFLADIGPFLSAEFRRDTPADVLAAVSEDGKTYAAPTLLQSYVVFANETLLERAGVPLPTGPTLSWDQLRAIATRTTRGGVFGLGWGLKDPTATIMSVAMTVGGTFFRGAGHEARTSVGAAEQQLPRRIHQLAYGDRAIAPTTLTQSGTDVLPGFYAGQYAMIIGGSFLAQQIIEQAPPGFRWRVLPPLAGTSARQAANPQTLSVSAASRHIAEATAFINHFTKSANLAALGQGDALIPSTSSGRRALAGATAGRPGWPEVLATAPHLTAAPYQSATNYPRWKDQIATPAFQRYLGDRTSLGQLSKELVDGWDDVNQ